MPILQNAERIAVWGFGREGRAAVTFVREKYPAAALTILNDTPLIGEAPDAPVLTGSAATEAVRAAKFDVIIKSPGVPLRRPEILAAKAAGVRFTSATDLWFGENAAAKKIAVTGTKGKSSTARLLHHLLLQAGYDAHFFGNVGIPVLGQTPGRDVTVLELSSYQIADLEFAPDIAVVTNLYPEHAPWHGGKENYFRDKLRLLDLGDGTPCVCNFMNDRLRERLAGRKNLVWFNARYGFAACGESLTFNGAPVDCSGFPLKGAHNYSNLAAACTAADLFGAKGLRQRTDLTAFKQLAHRLEEFSAGGILCVNDSLSTVPEAAIAALKTYAGCEIALILGGTDRGQDYAGLIDFLPQAKIVCAALLPVTGERIAAGLALRPRAFEYFSAADLEQAIAECFKRLKPGGVLLLSPAAPSFGQFKNYEERGNAFKALCAAHL